MSDKHQTGTVAHSPKHHKTLLEREFELERMILLLMIFVIFPGHPEYTGYCCAGVGLTVFLVRRWFTKK